MMDIHDALVFIHILATAGLFAATGAEFVALSRLTAAQDRSDAIRWLAAYRTPAGGAGQASMVALLVSGGAMGATRWGLEGWMLAALLALSALVVGGGVLANRALAPLQAALAGPPTPSTGRDPVRATAPLLQLWSHTRAGVLVGVLTVMVFKPSLSVSLALIAVSGGLAAALPRGHRLRARLEQGP